MTELSEAGKRAKAVAEIYGWHSTRAFELLRILDAYHAAPASELAAEERDEYEQLLEESVDVAVALGVDTSLDYDIVNFAKDLRAERDAAAAEVVKLRDERDRTARVCDIAQQGNRALSAEAETLRDERDEARKSVVYWKSQIDGLRAVIDAESNTETAPHRPGDVWKRHDVTAIARDDVDSYGDQTFIFVSGGASHMTIEREEQNPKSLASAGWRRIYCAGEP